MRLIFAYIPILFVGFLGPRLQAQSVEKLYAEYKLQRITAYYPSLDSLEPDEQAIVAYALLKINSFDKAEKAFFKAQKNGVRNAKFYHQFAQLKMVQQDFPTALHYLDNALSFSPGKVEILHDKAAVLFATEEWPETAFILKKLLKAKPFDAKYTAMLGHCYLEMEEPLNALKLYESYLPKMGNSRYDRDILWDCGRIARYRLGDLRLATEYFETLTKHFPEFWMGQQELVQLYNMCAKFLSAQAILTKASHAYEKKKLPEAWQQSGYWMTDALQFPHHEIHIYASLFNDDAHPAFKLFILDKSRQHVRGKVEVWSTDKTHFRLKLETSLKKEEHLCRGIEDYALLRSCIRKYLERIEGQ